MNELFVIPMVLAVCCVVVLAISGWRRLKAAKRRLLESQQKLIREALSNRQFAVIIRTQKATKTDLETTFIGNMVDLGLQVVNLKPKDAGEIFYNGKLELVPPDTLVILGFSNTTLSEISPVAHHSLDIRVLVANGEIKAARNFYGHSHEEVAHDCLCYLSEALR